MLTTLYISTLLLWLCASILGLLLFYTKQNVFLNLLSKLNLSLALLTLIMGFLGLVAPTPQILYIPGLLFWFQFHPELSINAISSFFVLLTGISYLGISLFATDYFKHFTQPQQCKIQTFMTLFIFSMLLVFITNDPFTFLFAWELMALTSYFLVVSIEPNRTTQKAGFLYLVIAHVGFFAITIAFFLLFSSTDFASWSFHHFTSSALPQSMANTIFILALLGFGAKAGLFPLHVWLPEAHPAAPSPVSALMSGVMLKTGIYGLFRFCFYFLLPYNQIWWGYSLVSIGLISMLMGVIHAAMQTDMKRLLAYSSIENMGFIITALGLSLVFYQYQQFILSDLALLIVFLHSLNHSLFKSLLFLTTGSILHATGERNFGKLGGLIHNMPWVSAFALIGTLALAGLPLLNGFISEWLYLGVFFHEPAVTHFTFAILSPFIIGISVLVFGLAGFVMVKFFGIAFLGQPRESQLVKAHPSSLFERLGLAWLALWCVVIGLWPNYIIQHIQIMLKNFIPELKTAINTKTFFLHYTTHPTTPNAFSPFLLGLSVALLLLIIFLFFKRFSPTSIRRAISWDCGFTALTSRMQDTAEGFSQPFKQIFENLINVKLQLPKADDEHPHYHSELTEKIWNGLYFPLMKATTRMSAITKWFQQGKMTAYLLYIGITLLALLIWIIWL